MQRFRHIYAFRPDGTLANPTVFGYISDYDPTKMAEELNKLCKETGRESIKRICGILGVCMTWQRLEIAQSYKSLFGEDLEVALKHALSGDAEKLALGLLLSRPQYCAEFLHKAMKGAGTDEHKLIQVLSMQTNEELNAIKKAYKEAYEVSLEEALEGETSGTFKKILIALVQASRVEVSAEEMTRAYDSGNIDSLMNESSALEQAQELYKAGEGMRGTDDDVFIKILVRQSHFQMPLICQTYESLPENEKNNTLESVIKSEFSGPTEEALLSILAYLKNPQKACAQLLLDATKGMGTNEDLLNYVIVTRSEVSLFSE
ncbi:Annexin A13 [Cichlidogyrus casuarinus]|uniref:Annexin A13 n=1 Tax=Cichlidogyrus casuarinus TaxID=1844966 RepID=A0ABD2QEM4_9PLAT